MHHLTLSSTPLPAEATVYYQTIEEIERHVASHSFLPDRFSRWQIGITADPSVILREQRKKGALYYWQVWEVTNRVGWSLQNYFRGRSMQAFEAPEASDATVRYLYLFKPAHSFWGLLQHVYGLIVLPFKTTH
jgi:hypothetical protein